MIELKPMSDADFESYFAESVRSYAEEVAPRKQISFERAFADAEKYYREIILPHGLQTPGQFLFNIVEISSGLKVGYLHAGEKSDGTAGDEIFGWDILIYPPYRRKGYARLAIRSLAENLKNSGYKAGHCFVWDDNLGAIHLYKSFGFEPTDKKATSGTTMTVAFDRFTAGIIENPASGV